MLFLCVLSLTAVLALGNEHDCGAPSKCDDQNPANDVAIDAAVQTFKQSGKTFPANAFFQQICGPMVEILTCVKGYFEACGMPQHLEFDFVVPVLIDTIMEFCDEESSLRKAYVDNVDCFNDINFVEDACMISAKETMAHVDYGTLRALREKGIPSACLNWYMFKPCVIDIAKENCGAGGAEAASEIMNRALNTMNCTESHENVFQEVLTDLGNEIGVTI